MADTAPRDHPSRRARPSRSALVFLGFSGIALLFLVYEHRVHALGLLPYLLVLACPLMHLFHHGGDGHGAHSHEHETQAPREEQR